MSATPRPWIVVFPEILATDPRATIVCSVTGAQSNPGAVADADLIVRAVNAFAALLAVAKAAEAIYDEDDAWVLTDNRDQIAAKRARDNAMGDAISALDVAHPGWRKWTP